MKEYLKNLAVYTMAFSVGYGLGKIINKIMKRGN